MRAALGTLLAFLIGAGTALAQGTTSRVVGTVTDQTSAVIPGANVTLTNDQTGVSFATVTTGTGNYVFEAVQVGRYTVAVQLEGFKKFISSGNVVNIGDATTVNVKLEPGGLAESVEVKGSSEVVQVSTSGNVGTTFEQQTIESLPILGGRGRNVLDLVLTQPGVVSGANTGGGVHVNGARDRAWNFTLDGIDTNESSAGGSNFSPLRTNPDSLAEFRVLTSNVTAEFGRNSGGQVAMITRSGTNDFHGTGFYFDRRPEYNANEYENNLNGLPKREFKQKVPGFSLGGPIQRNRTFFFTNVQWLRANQTRERTRLVYTAQARQGIWRYVIGGRNQPAGAAGASVDANGNPLPGVSIGTYSVGGSDPQRRGLDPTIQQVLSKTPLPNNFSTGDGLNTAGFTFTAPEEEKQYDFVTKIDHVFSSSHSAFVRIAKGQQNTNCDQVNSGEPVFPDLPCVVNTERSPYNWAANWRWNARSNMVNELVVGQNHFTFDFRNPSADPSQPTFSFASIAIPENYTVGNLRTIDTYQVVDNFSYASGAHMVKFGTNMRFQRHTDERGSVAGQNVSPIVNFSTTVNAVDPLTFGIPSNINSAFDRPALQNSINFLLGRVGSYSQGFVQRGDGYAPGGTTFLFDARYPELDFYAQDTWKPRQNLTVDAGVRWELKLSPSNPDNLIRRPDQRVAADASPSRTLRWEEGKLYDNDVNNVAPSIGAAWDPRGDGKSVVRANYRMAYDRINTFLLSSRIFQSIPGITTGVVNTAFGQAGGRLRDGLPGLSPTVGPEDFLQPAVSSNSITVVDPEFQAPLTHGWLLSYQHELWSRGVIEVSYIGRRAEHLFGAYDANQVEFRSNGFLEAFNIVKAGGESPLLNKLLAPDTRRRSNETGSQMVRRLFASNVELNSVASLAASLGSRLQDGRTLAELAGMDPYFFYAYPQFLGGMFVIDSNDYSRYHALQIKLDRRFANGYSYLLAYTLSRSKDTRSFDPAFTVVNTGATQSGSSTPFDIHDRDLNYSRSDFDRTHVFQAQWVAELPFGRGRRFGRDAGGLLNALIGGWQVSGQVVVESGRPFTVYSGTNTMTNLIQTPANCNGCTGSEGEVFFDPASGTTWYFTQDERAKFSAPAAGEFSNVGRNGFTLDGFFNANLSILKRTPVHGSQTLEFRVDATNITNTPSFGLPSSAVITSTVFGRIRDNTVSSARQIMLGVKYSF